MEISLYPSAYRLDRELHSKTGGKEMKLVFFKANKINVENGLSQIEIQPGGIQFQLKDKLIVLAAPVVIKIKQNGLVQDVLSSIQFDIYNEDSIDPVQKGCKWSLLGVIHANDGAVYNELLNTMYSDKVIPISRAWSGRNEARVYSERQMFRAEYEAAYLDLIGGRKNEFIETI